MGEKVLIKSEKYNVKKLFIIFLLLGMAVSITMTVCNLVDNISNDRYIKAHHHTLYCISRTYWEETQEKHEEYNRTNYEHISEDRFIDEIWLKDAENHYMAYSRRCPLTYPSEFSYSMNNWWDDFTEFDLWICLTPVVALTIIGTFICLWLNSYKMTVSDKRVSGEVLFGKKVDLPIDSVSAISKISLLKGIGVSTSSGKISFLAIKNAKSIYEVINNLLVDRQKEKSQNAGTTIVQNSDEADKLKKHKDLLDSGVITQEEFDAKKKQLLGF